MSKNRDEFMAVLAQEFPNVHPFAIVRHAKAMMRYGARHNRLAAMYCNGEGGITSDNWQDHVKKPRAAIAANYGALFVPDADAYARIARVNGLIEFSGDPRGATVKIKLPSGRTNSFGGEGWCVPNS